MSTVEQSIHEGDFCGQVASAANVLFAQDPAAFPFGEARVEGFGTGAVRRKRKDLRIFEPAASGGRLALCGEVKLPGTPEGRSAFDDRLYQDAAQKADNAGVRFFFTWNVNEFVLWDRSQWEKPPLERRVRAWKLGLTLASPEDVARPENLDFIRTRFLPDLLRDLADIYTGRRRDWTMPPDDIFIRSLESHLDWPVQLATAYLIDRTERSKPFDAKVQQWLADQDWIFVRNDADQWRDALTNMAKTLAYVWANRLIFYKALRARFSDLPRLELKRTAKTPADASAAFDRYFQKAVDRSGDYETLLIPHAPDWASGVVFEAPNALDAWRGLLRGIESVDFKDVPSDIVGRIFQKLIGPEERHRYGQHFTGDDVVDLISAFCVRDGADTVLDPACGSGSFLVRAYYRKRYLDPSTEHADAAFRALAESGARRYSAASVRDDSMLHMKPNCAPPRWTRDLGLAEFSPYYTTELGAVYQVDAIQLLRTIPSSSVDLVMTSPPFALTRKKEYGNEPVDRYLDWFMPFCLEIKRILKPTGSFVLDIGGAWVPGVPVRSVYQFDLAVRLAREFFLAQDFYWYNPARLPTPAEWVTVRRVRVKDAVNMVWWFAKSENPKSDNRRVLQPYSESMKTLLKDGYTPRKRPSGHDISPKFQRDNGGSIPPNLLQIANTESNSHYLRRCRELEIKPHPARYPEALVTFFLDFLTDVGDIVVDPFVGSNVTGAACEKKRRRWMGCDISAEYLEGSVARFEVGPLFEPEPRKKRTISRR
jgi:DNA modification methylase